MTNLIEGVLKPNFFNKLFLYLIGMYVLIIFIETPLKI